MITNNMRKFKALMDLSKKSKLDTLIKIPENYKINNSFNDKVKKNNSKSFCSSSIEIKKIKSNIQSFY
jgi:hypothetical protein